MHNSAILKCSVLLSDKMLHIDLAIGLDTDEELREGALHVLQLVRPDWPADSIRKASVSFSLVRSRGRGAAYAPSSSVVEP